MPEVGLSAKGQEEIGAGDSGLRHSRTMEDSRSDNDADSVGKNDLRPLHGRSVRGVLLERPHHGKAEGHDGPGALGVSFDQKRGHLFQ